jgi:hypothetical protein
MLKMNRRNFLKSAGAIIALCVIGTAFAAKDDIRHSAEGYDLFVAYNDGSYSAYNGRGITPLFDHLRQGDFRDAQVYDKVTGRASALLLAYGGAQKLSTGRLSRQATEILKKYNIEYDTDEYVDYIIHRSGVGQCIMEAEVAEINDANEAYEVLKAKLESLAAAE